MTNSFEQIVTDGILDYDVAFHHLTMKRIKEKYTMFVNGGIDVYSLFDAFSNRQIKETLYEAILGGYEDYTR